MGYKVIVEKGNLRFDSAHFITFGGKCEHLHGHSYGLSVTLEGPLTADSYVFDFVELKKIVRAIRDTLDHRFLLPLHSQHLEITQDECSWELRFKGRRYVFPVEDVVPLPLDNITAERLAEYVWTEIASRLRERDGDHLLMLTVGVEEAPGQTAFYSEQLSGAPA